MILWLTAMSYYHTAKGKPEQFTPEEEQKVLAADNLFRGGVISALDKRYVDNYIICTTAKELWDALGAKFGVSDAGTERYLMEQLFDYKIVDNRFVIEQTHEIQALAKELEQFSCVLPKKFVAGGIIAKLPPTWKDFATSLKHQRKSLVLPNSWELLMLRRTREQKTHMRKALSLLMPIWCRRKSNMNSVTRKRTSKTTSKGQIRSQSKLQFLRRKRQMGAALLAVVMTIEQVLVQTANSREKRKSQ